MAVAARLTGKRVYLDSNVFIYAFENVAGFGETCADILRHVDTGAVRAVASEISFIEILVGPLMAGARDLAARYAHRMEDARGLEILPVSRAVILRAAAIRATGKLKIPDAVHVATALDARCDLFVTADNGIPGSTKLPVLHLASQLD